LIGLIFVLWPTLKPEEPPTTKAATLSVTLDRVSLGQYLDRTGQSRVGYPSAVLRRQGALVRFIVNIKGYRNTRLLLAWQLIDAQSGDLISQARNHHVAAEVTEDQGGEPIWVPVPRGCQRRFVIELELLDESRAISLASTRTPRFSSS
jgi:hypothetical protein